MVEIWFEPHATTWDNENKVLSGWNDVDLSDIGCQQTQDLIERVGERKIKLIFCSDLQRAVKTAVPSAVAFHLPIYPDNRLRECDYGTQTGAPKSLLDDGRMRYLNDPFPDGESYNDAVLGRMASFYDELKQKFDGSTILIVGHRATHIGLEVFAAGRSLAEALSLPSDYWVGSHGRGQRYELR